MEINTGIIVKSLNGETVILKNYYANSIREPILLTLTKEEKELIANMSESDTHIALFPPEIRKPLSIEEKTRFISQELEDLDSYLTIYQGNTNMAHSIYEVLDHSRKNNIPYIHNGYRLKIQKVYNCEVSSFYGGFEQRVFVLAKPYLNY